MPRYQRHLFVCVNERPPDHPKGCCAAKGSGRVRELLKAGLKARGLSRRVRANVAGCLDACEFGTTVVIYPEGVWYGGVTEADVEEIIERHVIRGEVIQRLLMPPYAGSTAKLPPLEPAPVLGPPETIR
ncbi:MAG TPA: (2Fe-2S) ferredoxin domain-containing protein [Candidatus Polarisedimenticolia bacterium]|jgi:(2Fe-2S) ferredoxin